MRRSKFLIGDVVSHITDTDWVGGVKKGDKIFSVIERVSWSYVSDVEKSQPSYSAVPIFGTAGKWAWFRDDELTLEARTEFMETANIITADAGGPPKRREERRW